MPSPFSMPSAPTLALFTALSLVTVLAVTASDAHAQGRQRERIVVAVMPSGDVPPGIDRDVQDLFLTALADQGDYDLVDRETVYELTDLQGDVDLLLCVTRETCIQRLHDDHRFVHYVLVKVTEQAQELEFTYVTFNYKNREPIVFGDRYGVGIDDHVEFVNRAFAVADALELKPLDAVAEPTDPCAAVLCPQTQRCTEGRCVDIETPQPELPPEEPSDPVDWPLIAGITTTSVGIVLTGVAGGLYIHRQMRIDDIAAGYSNGGATRISTMDQQAAHDEIDGINSEMTIATVLLGVGLAATAAGAGVLTWALLDDGETDTAEPVGQVTIHPGMMPGGAALGATVSF